MTVSFEDQADSLFEFVEVNLRVGVELAAIVEVAFDRISVEGMPRWWWRSPAHS
jgi:hypothetical protein